MSHAEPLPSLEGAELEGGALAAAETAQLEQPEADRAAAGGRSIWRRIRRDVVVLGAGNLALVITQLGFRGILVATLAPSAYGRLALILSIYNSAWIIGSSGLPNSVARYLAICDPADDGAIVAAALRASRVPIGLAALIVAVAAAIILNSPLATIPGAVGLASLIYSLLCMGILRGRGQMALAAAVMPIAGCAELALLGALWKSGLAVTPSSGFVIFALGNVVGLLVAASFVWHTSPARKPRPAPARPAAPPTPRQLLGFSLWLALSIGSIAALPIVMRWAGTLDSYTVVAMIDVALVLFSVPQRLGTVILLATTPHASRQHTEGRVDVAISNREHAVVIVPFVVAAALVSWTPLVSWIFDQLGQPAYADSVPYLALALLAGPARILCGLVEGVLVAHGEGRFLGLTSAAIVVGASILIIAVVALGSTTAAFVIFVVAFWVVYLRSLFRVRKLAADASA